ncbi:amino-acid racemase [Paenibacillus elgii]|uniref:Amino-acid racemase n=1 Tax=Paenibacillus elgii TaxID=189691 RepID=A0A2T6FWT8_9BACL|nr:YhfX family PLP-dependent enzyme [Paenibacillus elgii]PUA36378.1 amino-acid racemase [Paenibacillus elgii]
MFVDMTLKRNEGLISAAALLHQDGTIPPNTYVIDMDALELNVKALRQTADRYRMNLYYMTKQLGRSGFVGKLIEQSGIERAVAVDIDEANNLRESGCQIGNIGHIVQPGKTQWKHVIGKLQPEVVTLFSYERAKQLSDAALELGHVQDVVLRVIKGGDTIFPGQFGGFPLEALDGQLPELLKLKGIRVAGVTSFPVLQINPERTDFAFTSNMETLASAVERLKHRGIEVKHVNAPSATCCHTIPLLAKYGVTHSEPGHAMTGTTPLHAYDEHLTEIPAMVYLSEISHMDDRFAYTIAGGFYARSNMEKALYGSTPVDIAKQQAIVSQVPAENIDYYGSLERERPMKVGDTVVYAFRAQIFVTRSHVAYVKGIGAGKPELVHFQRRGM